jgi:hypothetical protein
MQNISIDTVKPDRVEVTINPENDWRTTVPYSFVFPSLVEAVLELPGLYQELRRVQLG